MARGGKREGAGRPKGSRSAATKDEIAGIAELAKMHVETALEALVQIARDGQSESARVSAANALLDRGYGRPQQDVNHGTQEGDPLQDFFKSVSSGSGRIGEG